MTPAQFWQIEMQNQQNQQAQQQQNQQNIMSGIMGIADAYTESQQMKSDGKIYGDLLKFAAPLIGDTKGELLKRYNESEDREKVSMGRALFGGGMFATMSQAHNFGNRLGVQQDQPFVNQGLQNARNLGAGNVTYGADPANTVPLPTDEPLPAVTAPSPGATARPGLQNMTREQWDAMNEDLVRLGRQSRGPYPF
jgi:hypothetical protein